jgi:2-oxoisovalerate dehydrogenase E1 component alpha subunit
MSEVANFSIDYTRFLDEKGKPTQNLPPFAKQDTLLSLYQAMLLTRLFDNKAVTLQRTGKLNTYASTLGQEAISVGMGASMRKEDILCPFYRDYGAQLMRGVKMQEILSFWKGNEWGNHFSECLNDFPICVPIATQLLHAAGVATAFKLRKQARVVVTTCGDGATSKGDFYEALNIAGVWQLPVVFVINNNQWAISVPRKAQSHAQTLAQKAIAAGIHGEQVDGNDVIAVKFVVERAAEKARVGKGPSVIEALSYRLSDHTTADDASRYRASTELQQAYKEEPVLRLRTYLFDQTYWTEEQDKDFIQKCNLMIENAVNEYLALPKPAISDLFDYHFAQLPADLNEQRIEATALFKLHEMLAL